jgi:hypothetical protein
VNVTYIKGFLKKKPFKAFAVRTASGEVHKISHLESIAISPNEDLIILWPAEGGMVLVDADQITEAFFASRKKT